MQCLDWADFKNTCITKKNLNLQFESLGGSSGQYHVVGPDAYDIRWDITLEKKILDGDGNPIDNPDALDFVVNVMPLCNFAIGVRQYPANTGDFQADDDEFSGVFEKATDANTPKTTDIYYKFDHTVYVSGGEYWTTKSTRGDKVIVDIVDKDGEIVMPDNVADAYGAPHGTKFPPGTDLLKFIRGRRLVPVDNVPHTFQRAYWGKPPVKSYLRVRGIIHGTVDDVTFDCNVFLHKPI